jgi:hypothetical protein
MIKNVLTHIGGIGIYGIISICLFFAVFVGVLIWALTLKQSYLNSMRRLPLEDDPTPEAAGATPSHDE